MLTGIFRAAGVAPDHLQQLGSTLTILAGMGVALVPGSAGLVRFDDLLYSPIELAPGIHSELHLAWRKDNDNPACRVMLRALRQAVGQPR